MSDHELVKLVNLHVVYELGEYVSFLYMFAECCAVGH